MIMIMIILHDRSVKSLHGVAFLREAVKAYSNCKH